MKSHLAAVFAVLTAAFVVFATVVSVFAIMPPTDYAQYGWPGGMWLCDSGKTTVKAYVDPDEEWEAIEFRLASGDILMLFGSNQRGIFRSFMTTAGSKEMIEVTHEKWDEVLKDKAPKAFRAHIGIEHDCTGQ